MGWVAVMLLIPPAEASSPLRKLARGLANVSTGWIELPAEVARTTELEGSIAGLSSGIVRGAWKGLERTVVGAWEAATFVFANYPRQPGSDFYGPLIEPEFIVFRPTDKP
jgi:putative exosortase-associated protein (TIGR04073 family)